MAELGMLKVWHLPQIPGKPFEFCVESLQEAEILLDALADYDLFQYEHGIEIDFSVAHEDVVWDGVDVWDGEDWVPIDIGNKEDEKFIQDIKIGEHNA